SARADARDAGEVELGGVLAAGGGGVDDDLEVGVAVGQDVAVHGDVADLGVLDRLAVLGVAADRPVVPQRGEPRAAGQPAADQRGEPRVTGVTRGGAAQV